MFTALTDSAPRERRTARPAIVAYPVEFTGSGREYFRVWIVNLLLSIVTLGLYTPWARRRTAQYFYSHTHVAGSPLEFVAETRRMVFGFLAFAGLYLAYQMALETGQQLAAGHVRVAVEVLRRAPPRPGRVQAERDDGEQQVDDPDAEVFAAGAGESDAVRLDRPAAGWLGGRDGRGQWQRGHALFLALRRCGCGAVYGPVGGPFLAVSEQKTHYVRVFIR